MLQPSEPLTQVDFLGKFFTLTWESQILSGTSSNMIDLEALHISRDLNAQDQPSKERKVKANTGVAKKDEKVVEKEADKACSSTLREKLLHICLKGATGSDKMCHNYGAAFDREMWGEVDWRYSLQPHVLIVGADIA
jgi:hypothetical protein